MKDESYYLVHLDYNSYVTLNDHSIKVTINQVIIHFHKVRTSQLKVSPCDVPIRVEINIPVKCTLKKLRRHRESKPSTRI